MMKKILLLSAILCAPFSVYAADSTDGIGIVIGSEESLTEKNLPLDTDALTKALRQENASCKENKGFIDMYSSIVTNHFLAGAINIPFSIQDLYFDCDRAYYSLYSTDDKKLMPICRNYCSDFVFLYVQELVKNQGSSYTIDNGTQIAVNKDGTISGTITDDQGRPLSDCLISLISKEGNIMPYYINHSDDNGKFSAVIKDVFNDIQQISVLCPGHQSQTFSPGENMEIVISHEL